MITNKSQKRMGRIPLSLLLLAVVGTFGPGVENSMAEWGHVKTLLEAGDEVQSVAFSPDRKYIAYGGNDNNVYIHDIRDGWNHIQTLEQAEGDIRSVVFSPDGKYIAYGGGDETLYIHETENDWEEIGASPFEQAGAEVRSIAFSPDSRFIAYGSLDNNIYVHDAEGDWREVGESPLDQGMGLESIVFSPDGRYMASGGRGTEDSDPKVRIHDIENDWNEIDGSPLEEATDDVQSVAFSPDGKYIAYGSLDGNVYIHDIEGDWEEITDYSPLEQAGSGVRSAAFSPGSRFISYGSLDGNVYIHDIEGDWQESNGNANGFFIRRIDDWAENAESPLEKAGDEVNAVTFSRFGRYIAYGSADSNVYVHEAVPLEAQEITWRGVNTSALYDFLGDWVDDLDTFADVHTLTVEDYVPPGKEDPEDYDLWDGGRVPGLGDKAVFHWDATEEPVFSYGSPGDEDLNDAPIIIDEGDFNPDHIELDAGGWQAPNRPSDAQILIRNPLKLESFHLASGHTSAGQGQDLVVVEGGHSLTLTGKEPISFGGRRGGWGTLALEDDSELIFAGEDQTFDSFNFGTRLTGDGGTVKFTGEEAEVTLADPGTSSRGNILLSRQELHIRSDQHWVNPEGTGFIEVLDRPDGQLLHSYDGEPLNNLSEVAFRVDRGQVANYSYYYPEATLQGLYVYGDLHHTRTANHRFSGDLTLTGGAVVGGDDDEVEAEQLDYGLVFHSSRDWRHGLYLEGYDLTTDRGVHLLSTGSAGGTGTDYAPMYAGGSEIDIGGELFIESERNPAGTVVDDNGDSLSETRNIGIIGDADTVLTLRGDFKTNVRSTTGDNLHLSTVNLLEGTGETPNNFEVAADPEDQIEPDTYAVGTLNIGTEDDSAYIQLVNEYLNDNDPDNIDKTREGEILLANEMKIGPDSTLDLNGKGAKVYALDIDGTGTLNLNTGQDLEDGDIVGTFRGAGDQVDQWEVFADRVIDSSNPERSFIPVRENGDTYWEAR